MPNPRTLLSTYPPAALKNSIIEKNFKCINVYVDVKNAMTSLFLGEVMSEIALNSKNSSKLDSSIFQSFLTYTAWWKKFSYECDIPCKIFLISDIGKSQYHNEIYNKYKANRYITSTPITPYDEEFRLIRNKNFELAESVINNLPGVSFVLLKFLEADFVPYWLISRKFNDPETLHIVISNDHDMYQNFRIENNRSLQIFKKGDIKILTKNNVLSHYFTLAKRSDNAKQKILEKINDFDFNYIDALMGINGDMGDEVPGVDGFGLVKALDLFHDKENCERLIGSPEELHKRVSDGGSYFKEYDLNKEQYGGWKMLLENKTPHDKKDLNKGYYDINTLVTNSFKLVSYEQLSLWLEKRDEKRKIDWLNCMNTAVDKHNETGYRKEDFHSVLNNLSDNYITKTELDYLFL